MEVGIYKDVRPLDKTEDSKLRISELKGFDYAASSHSCAITVDEFYSAAKSAPIVFADAADGVKAVSLLGVREGQNVFVSSDGEWTQNEYIPAYLRRYPFIFFQQGDSLALGIDHGCAAVNKTKGKAVFNKNGEASDYVNNVLVFMQDYQSAAQRTDFFISRLVELDLLEDANATIREDNVATGTVTFKKISEEKLNALDDDKALALLRDGCYRLIAAHLLSLTNFNKLFSLGKVEHA